MMNIDTRILFDLICRRKYWLLMLLVISLLWAMMGIWGSKSGAVVCMAYWGAFAVVPPSAREPRVPRVLRSLPVKQARLATLIWSGQVFAYPLLVFSAVLCLSLLAYIRTYEPPRVVLSRCFFFLVVNLLMTGAVCAFQSLAARASLAYQKGGYPACAFWWIPAILSFSAVLGLFATAPFAIRELGSVGGPAFAAGLVFLVVSFTMRTYLVVDRRELARARNARKRNHGQESLKPEPKWSVVGHLAWIGLSVYLALMALVMLHEIVLFLPLNLLEKGGEPSDILFAILVGVPLVTAFVLQFRSRLMIRTLRMLPLTSAHLLALIIARYCAVAIAMAAAAATTQIIYPARLSGSTVFPMILPGLGLVLLSGACALLGSRPEFGMLPYLFVMPFIAGVMSGAGSNITPTFWALVGMAVIALGILLHYYAITHASMPYRVRSLVEIPDLR